MTDDPLIINFNHRPQIPIGFSNELKVVDQVDHKSRGLWRFNSKNLNPCLSDRQKKNKTVSCDYLKKYFCDQWIAGAQLLDFFLKNPSFIPEEWKDKNTFFLGSIYRDFRDIRCVRSLSWNGNSWYDDYRWLSLGFKNGDYILIIDTTRK